MRLCTNRPRCPAPRGAARLRRLALFVLAFAPLARVAAQPPNFVLIYADDLRRDDTALMPSLQEHVVRQGLSFDRFFVTTPLCSPSRSSLLRGQYAHNTGVLTNWPRIGGGWEAWAERGLAASTLTTWLHDAGYRTAFAGKFLNFYPSEGDERHVDPGWDTWLAAHAREDSADGGLYYHYQATDYDGERSDSIEVRAYADAPDDYSSDVFGRRIHDFILRALADGAPFFAYYAPYAPHTEPRNNVQYGDAQFAGLPDPAPRHNGAFAGFNAPRAPSFNEADMRDKPPLLRLPPLDAFATARLDTLFRARMETMLAVDEWIGRYVAALDSAGALDNTYILFASDQGFMYGEHRQPPEEKSGPYEESVHMPLFVRGPGVAPGTGTDAAALTIDLAPTLAELAGVAVPDFVDGRSLVPFLRGQVPPAWRNAVYVEHWSSVDAAPDFDVVRADSVKLIRSFAEGWLERYHLGKDPFELEGEPRHVNPLLDSLGAAAGRLAACAGDACRTADYLAFLEPPPPTAGEPSPGSGAAGLSVPVPNPASGTATLLLTVGRLQHVEVAAYDVLGRRVAVLFSGLAAPDRPQVLTLSAAEVGAGVYVVRATGADFAAVQQATLLR